MHPTHTCHARSSSHVHSTMCLVVLQRHERVSRGHVILATAQSGDDGVGEVAPSRLLVCVLDVHVWIGSGMEAVLARRGLESCYEACGRLMGSHLGRVLGLSELRVRDHGLSAHLGIESRFDVFGGVVCIECAHVGLHLCLLSIGVILSACGIRHLVLDV